MSKRKFMIMYLITGLIKDVVHRNELFSTLWSL